MNRWYGLILFFVVFGVLGYFREFFFVHINIIMHSKYYGNAPLRTIPVIMTAFERYSYDTLYYAKYPFTVIWTAIFFIANYFLLKIFTRERIFLKLLTASYVIVLLLAGLTMAYGYFINARLQDDEYTFSRWLVGIAQSPVPGLILLASSRLYDRNGGRKEH